MKIAYITPYYYPSLGGLQSASRLLSQEIEKHSEFSSCLVTSNMDVNNNLLSGDHVIDGNITRLGYKNLVNYVSNTETLANEWKLQTVTSHYNHIFKIINEIDIVYFFGPYYFKNHSLWNALKGKKPVIFRIFNLIAVEDVRNHMPVLKDQKNVYFHAISGQIKSELIKAGLAEKQIVFIPNPVDTELFKRRSLKKIKRFNNQKSIIYFGRIDSNKNISGLISIFKQLKLLNNVSLTICGGTKDKKQLRKVKDLMRLNQDINWLDEKNQSDLRDVLNKNSFYITASKIEGMSNSLLEAMSFGLIPIVPRSVPGMLDLVIDNKNGFTYDFNLNSYIDLSNRLKLLDEEDIIKIGINARETIKQGYSVERILKLHGLFYKEVLS